MGLIGIEPDIFTGDEPAKLTTVCQDPFFYSKRKDWDSNPGKSIFKIDALDLSAIFPCE